MDAYMYQAAFLCPACANKVMDKLDKLGTVDTGDSNDYPQGPYPDGGGKADSPQFCDHCREFLENPLTLDGEVYTMEHFPRNAIANMYPYLDEKGYHWNKGHMVMRDPE